MGEKRANDNSNNNSGNGGHKKMKHYGGRGKWNKKKNEPKNITEVVTPLAHLPYEQQLEQKNKESLQQMSDLLRRLVKAYDGCKVVPKYLQELRGKDLSDPANFPFEWQGIKGSPHLDGYRNKCEFTCALNKEGEKSVGFLHGTFAAGLVTVEAPTECRNIPEIAKYACRVHTEFVRQSDLECYTKHGHKGFWRLLMVRNNQENQAMIVVQVNPKDVPQEKLDQVKKDLLEHFQTRFDATKTPGAVGTLHSFYIQLYDGVSNAAPQDCPMEKLYGEDFFYESVLGLKFRISPKSFFQVNTKGAEMLYSIARDWANITSETTLFDVCCGTGTIGLTMAATAKQVIGLEIVADAIEDAKKNAADNNITNASYVCGKAEDTMEKALQDYKDKEMIGIVDPPRSGLHKSVARSLALCQTMQRLVYVSCNPATLVDNAITFCGPRSNHNFAKTLTPFKPVKALAVDMFPFTTHCEMVMLFERLKPEDLITADATTTTTAAATTATNEQQQ